MTSSFPDPNKNETKGFLVVPDQTTIAQGSNLLLKCPDDKGLT